MQATTSVSALLGILESHLLFLLLQSLLQSLPHLLPRLVRLLLKQLLRSLLPRAHPSLKNGGFVDIVIFLLGKTIACVFAMDMTILWPLGAKMLSATDKNF